MLVGAIRSVAFLKSNIGEQTMTDTGSYRTTGFCIDPGFNEVEEIFEHVKKQCGMSRSTCIRTIIHAYVGTTTNDPDQHECNVKKLNRALATLGRH
jgi:hypothetical protein